tara:strand:+ start:1231 stop:2217 length:987 start_codon:yes stop_codon:yes gene_type:complete
MPAFIDTMMYLGDTPWHKQGVKLDNPPNVEEALYASGLDWTVRKEPTYINNSQGTTISTGHYVTIRDDNDKILGNVSERYEILQNKDAFLPFKALLDYGYQFETAGAIQHGKKVWILAKAPDSLQVGDDKINPYILSYSSHDGSSGNCLRPTAIRVVCQNTLDIALNRKSGWQYNLRHTQNIRENVVDLSKSIDECRGNTREAIEKMNRMTEHRLTPEEVTLYFETVIPFLKERHKESIPELGIHVRNTAKPAYEKIVDNFYNGRGNNGRTLWDAYNAITEYYTHDKKYSDWVKSTQFGKAYDYKVDAFKVADSMLQTRMYVNGHGLS